MRLVRFKSDSDLPIPGIVENQSVKEISISSSNLTTASDPFGEVLELLTTKGPEAVVQAADETGPSATTLVEKDIFPPISENGRLFALGGVYTQHIRERNQPLNKVPSQWLVPETAIVGPQDPIVLPERVSDSVIPAVELGVVIGKSGKYIEERDALDHIAGYTIINDITARTEWPGPMAYKLMDTFSPCGPHVVTTDELDQRVGLDMSVRHAGDRICQGSTSSMRFTIPFIVSYLSSIVELRPGDVISTGDPGRVDGVLSQGETVTASISGIGSLTNPVEIRK
ncbi:fumarylacetoacetate hydrolase family protein [Haloarcula hispanica]|uniref:FAA hydrolase family protein n=1 Tax=Haloarcula hispanica TaxID=51589 RepID=A0A482T6C5_HALHI|nr:MULTISPECIES: fumarylacetoacetate hydrolase family protein [Haloarcula]MCJ0619388.1 fumarylacetoacetate hydrolase family protein [Haloarcula hispanica]RYJ09882.1 FAA hydrolase family protein [Haloarcula hispanica]